MSKPRPSQDSAPYDFSLYDQAEVVWRIPYSYRRKQNFINFWRLARRNGIWSFNKGVPRNLANLDEARLRHDQAIASYETVMGRSLALFQRQSAMEKAFSAACGRDWVPPIEMVICDKCGKGTWTTVERPTAAGPRVLCRVCAAGENPQPVDSGIASE